MQIISPGTNSAISTVQRRQRGYDVVEDDLPEVQIMTDKELHYRHFIQNLLGLMWFQFLKPFASRKKHQNILEAIFFFIAIPK